MKTNHHWKVSNTEKTYFMNSLQSHTAAHHYGGQTPRKPINFFCAAPHARAVELVGDFNEGHPYSMIMALDGWWLAKVELAHGHHQYRFLVDGQPVLDPHATGMVRGERGEQFSLIAVS